MVSAEQTQLVLRRASALPRPLWEPTIAAVAAAAFYVSLYGQLPYHDVLRFVAQIDSGKFVWDMGHVWLQPVTPLWHWYLGFGESAEQSQKHINTVFAAAGIGVFYFALMRFEIGVWRNWNAPWMLLTRDGMPKAKFVGFFDSHYKIVPLGTIAGMKAWQLLPRTAN